MDEHRILGLHQPYSAIEDVLVRCYTFRKDKYNIGEGWSISMGGSTNQRQAKVSSKGWVVIPASLRRRYGLKPGTMVEFAEEEGRIVISAKRSSRIEELFGKLAGQTSLTAALLEERAQELEREEARLRAG